MATRAQYQLVRSDGASWTVAEGDSLSIGRSRHNTVSIADSAVSRQHATLLVARGRCWIRDENSTHGTFVNGQRVAGQQEFRPGDELRIGSAVFRLELMPVAIVVGTQDGPLPQRQRRQRQGVLFVALAAAVIAVLAIAFAGPGIPTPLDRTPHRPGSTVDVIGGTLDVEPGGKAQVELYNGTQATVNFVDESGEVVEAIQATYISDETGVTVIAVAQGYRPYLETFETNEVRSARSSGKAKPALQKLITIHLDAAMEEYMEETNVHIDHLIHLPDNVPGWEMRRERAESACFVASGSGHTYETILFLGGWLSGPHFVLGFVGLEVLKELCVQAFAPSDLLGELTVIENEAADLTIALLPGYQNRGIEGIIYGQVVNESASGVDGATVRLEDTGVRTTTLRNGWYYFETRQTGMMSISAKKEELTGGPIEVDVSPSHITYVPPVELVVAGAGEIPSEADSEEDEPKTDVETRSITYGQTVSDKLSVALDIFDNMQHYWQFHGQAGDVINIQAHAIGNSFDPVLILRNGTMDVLAEGFRKSTNVLITEYRLPDSGSYVIEIAYMGPAGDGQYELTLNQVVSGERNGDAGVISADDLISGGDSGIDGLVIDNQTGGVVTVDIAGPQSMQGARLPAGPPFENYFGVPPGQYELTFMGCGGRTTRMSVTVPDEGAATPRLDCSDF